MPSAGLKAEVQPARPTGKVRRGQTRRPATQPLAPLGLEGRLAEQSVGERPHVEAGASDHERQPARRPNLVEPDRGLTREASRAVALAGVHEIQANVRHARQQRGVGLGRADVEPAVHLSRVGGDHRDRRERGERGGDRGLADRRRANKHRGQESGVSCGQTGAPARPSAAAPCSAGRGRRAPAASRSAAGRRARASRRRRGDYRP